MADVTPAISDLVSQIFETEAWPGQPVIDDAERLIADFLNTNQAMVREFHEKYQLVVRDAPVDLLPLVEELFRDGLLEDEVGEFLEAKTAAHRAKEAADVLYILYGDALHYGYDLDRVFAAVHQSNMSKDGGKRNDGKILKGPSYQPPDIEAVINSNPLEQPA